MKIEIQKIRSNHHVIINGERLFEISIEHDCMLIRAVNSDISVKPAYANVIKITNDLMQNLFKASSPDR